MNSRIMHNNFVRIGIGTVAVLSVPFIAMFFTDEVNWDAADFITMGALLLIIGLAYEVISKRIDRTYRWIVAVVLLVLLAYIWAELAVGIFTSIGS